MKNLYYLKKTRYISMLLNNQRQKHRNIERQVLIQMAQRDPVINDADVTSSFCDRLAQLELSDDLSTFGRPF